MRVGTTTDPTTWQDPDLNPPPRGCKLHLLTTGLVAVHGEWADGIYVAWTWLPKIPQELKDKLYGTGKI